MPSDNEIRAQAAVEDTSLASEQTLRYAQELRELYGEERTQRSRAEEALDRLDDSYATTVRALAAALELRDDSTGGHASRVASLALTLAAKVDPALASVRQTEYGFLLHDIGKIGIPDGILLKPGPLDIDERAEMERHPALGSGIIAQIPYLSGTALQIVAAHHERWDGLGYPNGLRGEQIPLAARIFALADTFDAMTNARPYRRAVTVEQALEEIQRCSGTQFDPAIVATFLALVPELLKAG
jgi:HD-GYP domain-containing protein (c-di-GMP phosphodiesterase class II)